MISAKQILAALSSYAATFPDEASSLEDLHRLLDESADATTRKEFRGHVTCSGVVMNARGYVALIKHKKLNKWLLPGGHVEAFDLTLRDAARREVREEIGVTDSAISDIVVGLIECPIEVDRHTIPANDKEPSHEHWDFRYLFRTEAEAVPILTDEIDELSEVRITDLSPRIARHLKGLVSWIP